jgi:hypothetical protein
MVVRIAASVVLIMGLGISARAQVNETWRGQVTVYGWGAGIGGDFTPFTGGPTLSFDKSLSEVLEDLDAAFFVTGLAVRGNFVVFGDLSYSKSSKSGLVSSGVPASGEVSQTSLTLAAGQRVVDDGTTTVDVLAGARAWWLDGEVNVPLAGVSLAPSKNFVDPIVALRVNHRIADRWTVLGYLDAGGFGVGSDLTYQVAVTASYKVTDKLFLSGGYRHLYLDYSDGGTSFDGAMSGPLVGATWRF